ncbi:metallophosphoesterase [Roseomonas sp. CCTCC AB2023176]|uniref:metallophosphoesterase n=1 Tax=Roseomonas sp. CCTCC AB2023176 TaxID=3342640 RepID=UPI0035E0766B
MLMTRRAALAGVLTLPLARARADQPPAGDALLILMSDQHSAMEGAAGVLAIVDAALAARRGTPAVAIINGDLFEKGNAVASRGKGEADWAFVAALRRRLPVICNLGNHEPDFEEMALVVAKLRALDVQVVTNIADARTGEPLAPDHVDIPLGPRRMRLVAMATDERNTYPAPIRPMIRVPDAVPWARENLPRLLDRGADLNFVLSHAGIAADRQALPLLPDGTLMMGGHDHLMLEHRIGATRYVHTGSWNRAVAFAGVTFGGTPGIAFTTTAVGAESDPAHAATVRDFLAANMTAEDREVLFTLPAAMPLGDAARRACAIVARNAGKGVGLIAHTTFGTGLPAGPVNRLAYDAYFRFDGDAMTSDADAVAVRAILDRANQDDLPLDRRSGDFLYAAPGIEGAGGMAAADWAVKNAGRYLGRGDLAFTTPPGPKLKAQVLAAFRG